MSRRQISLVVLAISSLVVTACSSSPMAPTQNSLKQQTAPSVDATDTITVPTIGTTESHG